MNDVHRIELTGHSYGSSDKKVMAQVINANAEAISELQEIIKIQRIAIVELKNILTTNNGGER